MNNVTLPAFSAEEAARARVFLATQVADMMGRKLEEGDWAKIYCAAKRIPLAGWSNTRIDIIHGALGVEQKAMCRRSDRPMVEACGTSIMHPAGTRSIRFPVGQEDPTAAAVDVLNQYRQLILDRTMLVDTLNRFDHGMLSREAALAALQAGIRDMSRTSAQKLVPLAAVPRDGEYRAPDMRMGWLLWQDSLREFLYFEEAMGLPDPSRYFGEWNVRSASGSRKATRNLWIFDRESGDKHFSVTVEAGVKIQPYFKVPVPNDPNLFHFVVQGEEIGGGLVRTWLSRTTAEMLRRALGTLAPGAIADAIARAAVDEGTPRAAAALFDAPAVEVTVPVQAYAQLRAAFDGVSDEDNFRKLIDALQAPGH